MMNRAEQNWPESETEEIAAKGFAVEETVDGRWMVLCNGVQWGKAPHDASGCSSQTWDTHRDAVTAILAKLYC